MVDLEKTAQLQKKYDIEILVVLPYDRDTIKAWLDALPGQIEKIRVTKSPSDPAKLDAKGKASMALYRKLFPKDLIVKKEDIPTPFRILVDADRKVSKGLGLFTTNWMGRKVDQNIDTIYVINKRGRLMFKYVSQNPADFPSYDYLTSIFDWITKMK